MAVLVDRRKYNLAALSFSCGRRRSGERVRHLSSRTNAGGRITLPYLMRGATYGIFDWSTADVRDKGIGLRKGFTVKLGETVDLGDILVEEPENGRLRLSLSDPRRHTDGLFYLHGGFHPSPFRVRGGDATDGLSARPGRGLGCRSSCGQGRAGRRSPPTRCRHCRRPAPRSRSPPRRRA
jgi:hypothetical protein